MSKLHIKKGDQVVVLSGVDKGKTGSGGAARVKRRRPGGGGVAVVAKHAKPSAKNPQGGIEKKEAPIHIAKLNLLDPSTGKATRVGRRLNDEGKLVRYSKKSGEEIK